MRMSGNMKRATALVLTVLLAALMLAGCSSKQCVSCGRSFRGGGYKTGMGYVCDDCYQSSGAVMGSAHRNTSSGVWVAIVVMVFVVVLSATSGVVYIVLRQKLEQRKPVPRRSQLQPPVRRTEPPRPTPRQSPPVPRQSPPAPAQQGSSWICSNDRSRNTGRFCVACGAPRPAVTPPRAAGTPASPRTNPARPANPAARPQPASPAYNRPQAAPAAPKYREPANPIFNFDEAAVEPVHNPIQPEPAFRPRPAAALAQPEMPVRPSVNPVETQNAPQSRGVPIIPEKPITVSAAPATPVIPVSPVQPENNPPVPEKPAAPVTPPPVAPAKKGFRTAYVRPAEPAEQEETNLLSEIIKSGEQ